MLQPVPRYHYSGPFLILILPVFISVIVILRSYINIHRLPPIQVEHLTHISSCFLFSTLGWRNYQVIFSSSRQGCPTSRPWAGTSCHISGGRRFSKEHKPHCEPRSQEGLSCQLLMRIIVKPSMDPPPLSCGKIAFRRIGPWGQKGWGPLL